VRLKCKSLHLCSHKRKWLSVAKAPPDLTSSCPLILLSVCLIILEIDTHFCLSFFVLADKFRQEANVCCKKSKIFDPNEEESVVTLEF